MSGSEDDEKGDPSFTGLIRLLNYRRELVSATTARVSVPMFPYTTFDNAGRMGLPWPFLQVAMSASIFALNMEDNDSSFMSQHKLVTRSSGNTNIIAAVRGEFNPMFHSSKTPKFPIDMEITADRIGNSSRRVSITARHTDVTMPYGVVKIDDVCVNRETKKPVPFPQWWSDMFSFLKTDKREPLMKKLAKPDSVFMMKFDVQIDDIDFNFHTNYSSYVKWSYMALEKSLRLSSDKFKLQHSSLFLGTKSFSMLFLAETVLDDKVTVEFWEDQDTANLVNFVLSKEGGKECSHVVLEFFDRSTRYSAKSSL